MDEQQAQWRRDNRRNNPASEGEFLASERALGHLSIKRRGRVLGMFHTCVDGVVQVIPDRQIQTQQFTGLSFVGAVSTLNGQEGLHSQCLWYSHDQFDWFWAKIEGIQTIELRTDPRFRGGTPCVWLTTSIAEYALTIAHATFANVWDGVLDTLNAPRCDIWPRHGTRPDWWPVQSSGQWPGDMRPGDSPSFISADMELRQLTEQMSMQPSASNTPWRRLGPRGDQRYPGQPLHHLGQLLEWDLAHDAGIKVTRDQAPVNSGEGGDLEASAHKGDKGRKRKKLGSDERRRKLKRRGSG